jgi:alcohol dehydrogenase class IV
LLPVVIEYNEPVVAGRLLDLFGKPGSAGIVRELNERIGIAPRLRDYGVTSEILPALSDKAIQDGCHQNNPRPCTREDLLALYRRAL